MHWLDLILLVLLGISLIRGFSSGFIKQAIETGSVVGALHLATPFSPFIVDLLSQHGPTITNAWFAWMLSFMILTMIFNMLAKILLSGFELILGGLNRILGAILSFLITTIILSILVGFYSNIGKEYNWPPVPEGLKIYPIMQEVSRTILPNYLLLDINNTDLIEINKI